MIELEFNNNSRQIMSNNEFYNFTEKNGIDSVNSEKWKELEIKSVTYFGSVDKTCCPICGHSFDFDEIKEEGNICPTDHTTWGNVFGADDLIGEYDDYLWCQ